VLIGGASTAGTLLVFYSWWWGFDLGLQRRLRLRIPVPQLDLA
jgi:hypothetical protein